MRSIPTLARGAALCGALTLISAPAALAAQTATGESTPLHLGASATTHAASSGSGSSVLRTIIALVVVIGIIYAVARILKAIKGRDTVRASGSGLTQIASLPLGPNKSVAVVRAGREIVLIGISENGVTALKTYTEAEAIEAGIDVPPADTPTEPSAGDGPLDRLRRLTVRS